MKCISCNAPVVETIDGDYVCVDCGDSPIEARDESGVPGERDGVGPRDRIEANTEVS